MALSPASSVISGGGFTLLDTQTVGAGGSQTIDFTSISQNYRALRIHLLARSEAAATTYARLRFNNDSSAAYWNITVVAEAAVTGPGQDSQTSGRIARVPTSASSQPSFSIIEFPFYTDAAQEKFAIGSSAMHDGTNKSIGLYQTLWNVSAAVSRITFILESAADFEQGSYAQLFGLSPV